MVQRQAARQFVEQWSLRRGSEKGEDQQFWNSLLRDVLGVADVENCIQYQVPVPVAARDTTNHESRTTKHQTKFLDAWIPETRVLIEHKSRGVNLDAPQSGHDGLTPYEQAVEYDNARPFDEKARWIVTCNFDEFRIYDRSKPLAPPLTLKLGNLPKEAYRLAFLVNPKEKAIDRELEISVQAGRIVGEIYDALLKQYYEGSLLSLRGDSETRSSGEDLKKSPSLQNSKPPSSESNYLAALNRLCVRLVFCLYAEDAEIFPKDCFRRLLEATPAPFLRKRLIDLFQTLDTPLDKRNVYLEPELCAFPYTNGGLFSMMNKQTDLLTPNGVRDSEKVSGVSREQIRLLNNLDDIPPMTDEIRQLLIGASQFDWRDITPTIFGALFESTLNPVTRRAGGMSYTSVENIHKVIDPLFLNDLTRRVNVLLGMRTEDERQRTEDLGQRTVGQSSVRSPLSSVLRKKLLTLQDEIASLTFLDPACGSGNFLTETYICLRRLENRIIAALQGGQGELDLGISIKVSIAQFFGIEINDFAARVARIALWIAEAQMRRETAEILHREPDYLPLKDYANIIEGNALRLDWPHTDYIIGNPPFRGARNKSPEQAADLEAVFGKDWKGLGNLDYVTAWYKKAADCILAAKNAEDAKNDENGALRSLRPLRQTKVAFVSTNSICQGDGVAALWKPLVEKYGVEIDFAHRTFRWDNEAFDKAHVHCVIVGFHCADGDIGDHGDIGEVNGEREKSPKSQSSPMSLSHLHPKTIFDGGRAIPADHINACLAPGPDVWFESRARALFARTPLVFGSMPNDGGFLSNWSPERRAEVVARWPAAEALFRRLVGSDEAINDIERWCLWLKGVSPDAIRAVPPVMEAVSKVREHRLASSRAATRKLAATPTLFGEIRQPESGNYLLIPKVSSEKREYIPMAFLSADVIASDLCLIVPGASLADFGVLTSRAHMAFTRATCGRLKSDYRYSAKIVYNNFPWPEGLGDGDIGDHGDTGDHGDNGDHGDGRGMSPKSPMSSKFPFCSRISATAQAILDARARYPKASLADLYDPLTMPPDLRAAHEANDRAVLAAYGLAPDTPEMDIVAHLFKLYADKAREKDMQE